MWLWPMRFVYHVAGGLAWIILGIGVMAVTSVLFLLFLWSMDVILEGP